MSTVASGTRTGTGSDPLRAVATPPPGLRPPGAVGGTLTFAWRALLRIRRVPDQLVDVTLTPVLFTLMFTYLFGGAVAGDPKTYLQYLLPGVLVQAVLIVTVYTGATVREDIERGVSDRFRSLPVWRPSPVAGALLGDSLRYALASTVTLGLGLALGFRARGGVTGVLLAVALLLVFALAVSWVFLCLALLTRSPGAVTGLSMLVLMPLTFASNVFTDPATMPGWLRMVVEHNPVSHLTTAVRELMAGHADVTRIGWVLAAAAVLTGAAAPVATRLYRARG